MFSMLASICISKAYGSIWTLLLYTPSSLIVLYQNECRRREISAGLCQLGSDDNNQVIKTFDKTDAKSIVKIKEQKNMVSNVAHDLKTVSNK